MRNEPFNDNEKTVLTGRIYPAIQSCVLNRYRIAIGLLAYYAFIFQTPDFKRLIENMYWISIFVTGVFGFFVFHNAWNYYKNTKEQMEIEWRPKPSKYEIIKKCHVEFLFELGVLILIVIAQVFLVEFNGWR